MSEDHEAATKQRIYPQSVDELLDYLKVGDLIVRWHSGVCATVTTDGDVLKCDTGRQSTKTVTEGYLEDIVKVEPTVYVRPHDDE